jgi:hypothetical protein
MVASCWLFLNDLYYDARIQEHQVYKQALNLLYCTYCYDADELNQQPWYMILYYIRSIQRKQTLILRL